jgi:hypothetical protein
MSDFKAVVKEAIHHMTQPISIDQLMQNCFADGIPLTKHQARALVALVDDTLAKKGFYTMAQKANGKGTVFCFYNAEGDMIDVVSLNVPEISKERKIPTRKWLEDFFEHIGYHKDRLEVKFTAKLLESHIRDGGSWTSAMNGDTIIFVLKMANRVKTHIEYHREDLTQ